MSLYSILAAIHVIAAIGGLGQTSVIGFMARDPEMVNLRLLRQIFKAVGGSLVIMLLTGLGMMFITHWVFEHTWWFRIGFMLYVALGAMHGIGQSRLKRISKDASPNITSLRTLALLMSITLAAIAYLMEAKPF